MPKHRHKSKKGFTLVELMVALAVLTVGMGTVAVSVQTAIRWTQETRNRQIGLHQARNRFEYYRDYGFHLLDPGYFTHDSVEDFNGIPYTTIYQVSVPSVNPNLKKLTLYTYWPNSIRPGYYAWVRFDTFVCEPLHF